MEIFLEIFDHPSKVSWFALASKNFVNESYLISQTKGEQVNKNKDPILRKVSFAWKKRRIKKSYSISNQIPINV